MMVLSLIICLWMYRHKPLSLKYKTQYTEIFFNLKIWDISYTRLKPIFSRSTDIDTSSLLTDIIHASFVPNLIQLASPVTGDGSEVNSQTFFSYPINGKKWSDHSRLVPPFERQLKIVENLKTKTEND